MKQTVFTIYDNKAQAYRQPFFTRNAETAIRSIRTILESKDDQNDLVKHTVDFELYQLGEYDDNTGILDTYPPSHVTNLSDIKL